MFIWNKNVDQGRVTTFVIFFTRCDKLLLYVNFFSCFTVFDTHIPQKVTQGKLFTNRPKAITSRAH